MAVATSTWLVPTITAAATVLTALLGVIYAPTWKNRLDRRRDQIDRSERLRARYSEPLVRAAFELQSRLYNITRRPEALVRQEGSPIELSTLWLFGQYLAWVEILRREVQVLDIGDVQRTSSLQGQLFVISDVLASTKDITMDPVFNVVRSDQRAIGELMVVDRNVGGESRSDSMGFAEFKAKLATESSFADWFDALRRDMALLYEEQGKHLRPVLIQRSLIDLVDILDADRLRFPFANERGKLPLPKEAGPGVERKHRPPAGEIARFHYRGGCLWHVVESWATPHGIRCTKGGAAEATEVGTSPASRVYEVAGKPVLRRHWYIELTWTTEEWFEIRLLDGGPLRKKTRPTSSRPPKVVREALDDLLQRFDRPRSWWPAGRVARVFRRAR